MREKIVNIIVIVIVFCLGVIGTYYFMSNNSSVEATPSVRKNVTVTEADSINESIQKVYDSVVVISNYSNGKLNGYGSGFVYKKDNKYGYIMTNNHVIEGANEVKVTLNTGEEIEAKVLGTDSYMDVAIVSVDASKITAIAEIGDSSKSKLGDTIFTVGTPISPDYAGTVTKGIISGENREITVTNNGTSYMMEAIQIDASINPGNSGGPLVNINGQVIGINSVKLIESSIEGMGFAIPIEVAMSQITKLEKGETIDRPLVGISSYDLSSAIYLGRNDISDSIKNGVIINYVEDGSDAASAGLEKNDIITEVDGITVKSSAHLKYLIYKHNIGDTVKLTIYRNNKEKDISLKLTHKIGD